ncbi:hypothetical protein [Spongiactinospora rosea]|uniref:hypothetical protein n=1 Tax=Spongiactinospora rosea TaxID=2248750 RepID=UPI0011C018C0|nr:hypothetical protein [Spongiactinospora rosea]
MTRRARYLIIALAVLAGAAAVAFLLSRSEHNTTKERSLADIANSIARAIGCPDKEYLYDDLYFWDTMYGVNCYNEGKGGKVTVVRAYRTPESIPIVLQDWQPLITSERPLITGKNWFAVGSAAEVQRVRKLVEGASAITTHVPQVDHSLSPEREAVTTCVRFAAGAINDRALNSAQYRQMLPYLDKMYPGFKRVIEGSMPADSAQELKQISEHDVGRLEPYISKYGIKAKEFCADRFIKPTASPK